MEKVEVSAVPSAIRTKRATAAARASGTAFPLHNGRTVFFDLVEVKPGDIADRTFVYEGNERDQSLLNEESVADLRSRFKVANGQLYPAFGRLHDDGRIEVGAGSSRRYVCMLDGWTYKIWVAKGLTNEEMDFLSEIENTYRKPSAYELGKKHMRQMREHSISNANALEIWLRENRGETVSRKTLGRRLKTAALPEYIITAFSKVDDLSAEAGEKIYKFIEQKAVSEDVMKKRANHCQGSNMSPEERVRVLTGVLKEKVEPTWLGDDQVKVTGRKIDCSKLTEKQFTDITKQIEKLLGKGK